MTEKKTICPCGGNCNCDPCECDKTRCSPGMKSCASSWCGWRSVVRIAVVVLLIVSSYAWGVWNGAPHARYERFDRDEYRNMEKGDRKAMINRPSDDMIRRHCEEMPDMDGCQQYSGRSTNTAPRGTMMDMSMGDMSRMLEGMTGDTLDQAFLEMMIPHHQAAVEMAKYLAASSKPELVKLGADIITAQTKEIEQMKAWQKAWGYTSSGSTNTGMMTDQSMMR